MNKSILMVNAETNLCTVFNKIHTFYRINGSKQKKKWLIILSFRVVSIFINLPTLCPTCGKNHCFCWHHVSRTMPCKHFTDVIVCTFFDFHPSTLKCHSRFFYRFLWKLSFDGDAVIFGFAKVFCCRLSVGFPKKPHDNKLNQSFACLWNITLS